MDENFSLLNLTHKDPPKSGLLHSLKNTILGKEYELSLVWIGSTRSRRINRERRGKDKPTNILSFPLSSESGEIFIDRAQAKKDAKKWNEDEGVFLVRLFIHGMLHLKGYSHGSTMESIEETQLRHAKKILHRHRN